MYRPIFIESAAPNPEASDAEKAAAFKEVIQSMVTEAYKLGVGDIYFLASDEQMTAMAENQVFKKVPLDLYRLRVSDLEPHE